MPALAAIAFRGAANRPSFDRTATECPKRNAEWGTRGSRRTPSSQDRAERTATGVIAAWLMASPRGLFGDSGTMRNNRRNFYPSIEYSSNSSTTKVRFLKSEKQRKVGGLRTRDCFGKNTVPKSLSILPGYPGRVEHRPRASSNEGNDVASPALLAGRVPLVLELCQHLGMAGAELDHGQGIEFAPPNGRVG